MITVKRSWKALILCAALPALTLAGCGTKSTPSASDDAVLGATNKASGAPIKIALSSEGKAAQFDTTPEIDAAKAAASYVNEYLGGINGRPLEISMVCENQAQPSRTRDCANKFVQSDAVALVSGPTAFMDTTLEVTTAAKLPYFNLGATQSAFSSQSSFVMTNSLGAIAAVPARYAKDNNIGRIAILTIDVPAAVEPLRQLGALVYGNAGITPNIVPVPPGTPDQTPQVQAALNKGAQMFHVLGDPAFCTSALKALRTLQVKQPIAVIGQCIGDESVAAQIPGGYQGLLVAPQYATDPAAADTKVFDAVINKYTASKNKSATAPTGYQAVLGFARAMNGFHGDATRQRIAAHLSAMPAPQQMPLGGGATFQCGSKAVVIAPSICAKAALLGTAQHNGSVSGIKVVDISDLLRPPGA